MASALNPVERALKRIFAELADAGVPCALIGGLAVSARAEPRTTRDVDVAISAGGDAAAEQLIFHLQNRGYVMTDIGLRTSTISVRSWPALPKMS